MSSPLCHLSSYGRMKTLVEEKLEKESISEEAKVMSAAKVLFSFSNEETPPYGEVIRVRRESIKKIVEMNPAISDSEIVRKLAKLGIHCSRTTVNGDRGKLGINSRALGFS